MEKRLFFIFAALVLCSSLFLAGCSNGGGTERQISVKLPQTGQTMCYDASGNVILCAGTGQDGEKQMGVAWPNPRFTNPDGTTPITGSVVVDQLTGFMWLKDANCITTSYVSFDNDGTADGLVTWQHALDFVAGINAGTYSNCGGGHSDWRLPNKKELRSLINRGQANSATWLNANGFSNVQASSYYWSSTTFVASSPTVAWVVRVDIGEVANGYKTYNYHVWPVRDAAIKATISLPRTGQTTSYATGDDGDLQKGVPWPNPRFTDSDGTTPVSGSVVLDQLTGLTWLKDANCINSSYVSLDNDGTPGDGLVTWQHALDFVAGINAGTYSNCGGGRSDWRLPNDIEIESLTASLAYFPALPAGHPFTNVQADYYWSSTTLVASLSSAEIVSMSGGHVVNNIKADTRYVWPVRGGQ